MAMPTLDDYINQDIFELLKIENAPDEKKRELLETMRNTVDARVIQRVSALLTDAEANEFNKLAESGDSDKVVQFLVDKEIDLPQIVAEEAIRHRTEIITLVKSATEK